MAIRYEHYCPECETRFLSNHPSLECLICGYVQDDGEEGGEEGGD